MIELDSSFIAITITILLAIIGLAAAWGALGQKVKGQGKTIEINRKEIDKDIERLHTENREDHRQIFSKLEEINNYIRNRKEGE